MGLFSFLKNAGAKILSGDSEQKLIEINKEKAVNLQRIISELNLPVREFSVDVDGDAVTVYGEASTQADREKAVLAVGNIAGVSSVDDRISVIVQEPEATFYTVQSGDSLSKIAKAHYGDAMKYKEVFAANQPMLKEPDMIYPGQVLRLPVL